VRKLRKGKWSETMGKVYLSNLFKEFWNHKKVFFFIVGLLFVLLGFFLIQIKGFGEEKFVLFWYSVGIHVTLTHKRLDIFS